MRCVRARRLISRDLDQRLSPTKRVALAEHVDSCPACSRFQKTLQQAREAMRGLPSPAVPSHLVDNVLSRVVEESAHGQRAIAAAIALFFMTGAFFVRGFVYPAVGVVTADLRLASGSLQGDKATTAETPGVVTREDLRERVAQTGGELIGTVADPMSGRLREVQVRVAARELAVTIAALEALTGARVRQPFLPIRAFAGAMRITLRLRVVAPE